MSVITDSIRRSFLDALDDAENINVSDWEARFIETNVFTMSFSEAQREAIDKMIFKYGKRLSY